jgi:hypothetical protein
LPTAEDTGAAVDPGGVGETSESGPSDYDEEPDDETDDEALDAASEGEDEAALDTAGDEAETTDTRLHVP